jgi:Family of unknown function (DUF5715)
MCRTAIILIALSALTATGARGSQVSTTKAHRRTPVAASRTTHTAYSKTTSHGMHPTARVSPSSARSNSNTAHRQSADEVGRAAGLAIRSRLAQRRGYRSHATLRQVRLRRTYAARSVSAADFDTQAATPNVRPAEDSPAERTNTTLEDAAASVAANAEQQNAEPATPIEGQAFAGEQAQTPATPMPGAAVTSQPSHANADNGSAPVERLAPAGIGSTAAAASAPLGSATANSESADEDAVDRNLPPPTEAASVRTESEEASLVVPHGLMPSPLRGSLESLERQNAKLDAEGLERIEDETDLAARIADGLLVPVPASGALTVNSDLPPNHRYCRPWTARFLADLARSHEAVFHKPLEVSSAVRTVEYQRHLMMTNGNAAPAEGDIVSPHLTGATVDIAKSGLSRQEMAWMRQHLLALQTAGKIDVEEEFRQACFHITVYKNYASERKTQPRRHDPPSEEDEAGATTGM